MRNSIHLFDTFCKNKLFSKKFLFLIFNFKWNLKSICLSPISSSDFINIYEMKGKNE